ncbi:MAG: ATPase domain-containing protein [Thermoplasmata archaeon]
MLAPSNGALLMAAVTLPPESAIPSVEPRISTGVESLDTILYGGLVAHRPYLVVGPSGTGKTTLALKFLTEGVRRGERVLLVTLEEPPNEVKANHHSLQPELDSVYVFDAIPDVMRYERAPFKDIATVRQSAPFRDVSDSIRKSPELASVEITFSALEQTLRSEVTRRHYTRIVIDSLTALQYFCMKGFDETIGAQTFLRFLSDLKVTTLLTVESPLEDVETPERLLARGEIRLFRWELEGQTVRAVGVEKFRGSPHDTRLHPYRIGPQGLDVNLAVTISRDTRLTAPVPSEGTPELEPTTDLTLPSSVGSWGQDLVDLGLVGADLHGVRATLARAAESVHGVDPSLAPELILQARGEIASLVQQFSRHSHDQMGHVGPEQREAMHRLGARATEARVGLPPGTSLDAVSLPVALDALLDGSPPSLATRTPVLSPLPSGTETPERTQASPSMPRSELIRMPPSPEVADTESDSASGAGIEPTLSPELYALAHEASPGSSGNFGAYLPSDSSFADASFGERPALPSALPQDVPNPSPPNHEFAFPSIETLPPEVLLSERPPPGFSQNAVDAPSTVPPTADDRPPLPTGMAPPSLRPIATAASGRLPPIARRGRPAVLPTPTSHVSRKASAPRVVKSPEPRVVPLTIAPPLVAAAAAPTKRRRRPAGSGRRKPATPASAFPVSSVTLPLPGGSPVIVSSDPTPEHSRTGLSADAMANDAGRPKRRRARKRTAAAVLGFTPVTSATPTGVANATSGIPTPRKNPSPAVRKSGVVDEFPVSLDPVQEG